MARIGKDIKFAVSLLRADQLVAIPTETVYGLAGNCLSLVAVARIFEVKNRPHFDPLIIHTNHLDKIGPLIEDIPAPLKMLASIFMPGPLTILVRKKPAIPDLVTSGSPFVAVRIPDHPLTLELLDLLDFPLAAPSANPFGSLSPTRPEHVDRQLGDRIPYILDGGPCRVGIESTIVTMEGDVMVVLRKGGVTVEELQKLYPKIDVRTHSSSQPEAPGMLHHHYAPVTRLSLEPLDQIKNQLKTDRCGFLAFQTPDPDLPLSQQRILSPRGNLEEAARHFFSSLFELDQLHLEIIVAELLPEEGLGRAINDKLRRAKNK